MSLSSGWTSCNNYDHKSRGQEIFSCGGGRGWASEQARRNVTSNSGPFGRVRESRVFPADFPQSRERGAETRSHVGACRTTQSVRLSFLRLARKTWALPGRFATEVGLCGVMPSNRSGPFFGPVLLRPIPFFPTPCGWLLETGSMGNRDRFEGPLAAPERSSGLRPERADTVL